MIEYFLHTGSSPNKNLYENLGSISNGVGTINNNKVLSNSVYLNGVTLLETLPSITTIGQTSIIDNSGDFFLSGNQLRNETGFLDLNGLVNSLLKSDIIETGSHSFYESNSNSDLISGFSGVAGNLSDEFIYLNGDKLTSGESYIINSNSNFEWIDSDTEITGVLFSMPKQNEFMSTGYYDVFGIKFNQSTSICFLNGQRIDSQDFLETASINESIISTGIDDQVEFLGGIAEYNINVSNGSTSVSYIENNSFSSYSF